jgi:hypothetical protein
VTAAQMLLNMKAAHAARTRYQEAADRLQQQAIGMRQRGFPTMARQLAGWSNIAQRAARAEYER